MFIVTSNQEMKNIKIRGHEFTPKEFDLSCLHCKQAIIEAHSMSNHFQDLVNNKLKPHDCYIAQKLSFIVACEEYYLFLRKSLLNSESISNYWGTLELVEKTLKKLNSNGES